jgi:cell division protein ZapB
MGGPNMLETELVQLEERLQRLVAAYQQAKLERRRALQERDRLVALNAELRKRIEGVIQRIRTLETESDA